jgi:hypothetical protein
VSNTTPPVSIAPFNLQTYDLVESFSIREIEQIRRLAAAVSTHAEFWEQCDRADWMIAFLSAHVRRESVAEEPVAAKLRQFACWCAREACSGTSAAPFQTLLVAERVARGEGNATELQVICHRASGGAGGAGSVGLPMGEPIAAIQLACFHAANPDPLAAARLSSSFAAKAEQFRVAQEHRLDPARARAVPRAVHPHRWVVSYLAENPGLAEAIAARAFARQAGVLRFLVPAESLPWSAGE